MFRHTFRHERKKSYFEKEKIPIWNLYLTSKGGIQNRKKSAENSALGSRL